MDQVTLRAEPRTDFGTRPSRRSRRDGTVPAIVYGRGLDAVAVSVGRRELHSALHTDAGSNALINLDLAGGKTLLTVAREIQRHPVRGDIGHLDFINISLDEKIEAEVGLEFLGTPRGVKVDAGIVETIRASVAVMALPMDIPPHIPLDISAMEVEHVVRMLDAVREAAAVPVPDDYRGEELKMYVSLKNGLTQADCRPDTIIEHCRLHLAPFKIPRYVAYVETMPYTPSNKVAKHEMTADVEDLRTGAWDDQDEVWR